MWKSENRNGGKKIKTTETESLDPTETLNPKQCGNQKVKSLKSCNCTNIVSFQYFKKPKLNSIFLVVIASEFQKWNSNAIYNSV